MKLMQYQLPTSHACCTRLLEKKATRSHFSVWQTQINTEKPLNLNLYICHVSDTYAKEVFNRSISFQTNAGRKQDALPTGFKDIFTFFP